VAPNLRLGLLLAELSCGSLGSDAAPLSQRQYSDSASPTPRPHGPSVGTVILLSGGYTAGHASLRPRPPPHRPLDTGPAWRRYLQLRFPWPLPAPRPSRITVPPPPPTYHRRRPRGTTRARLPLPLFAASDCPSAPWRALPPPRHRPPCSLSATPPPRWLPSGAAPNHGRHYEINGH